MDEVSLRHERNRRELIPPLTPIGVSLCAGDYLAASTEGTKRVTFSPENALRSGEPRLRYHQ
jgi:hypothetical protein